MYNVCFRHHPGSSIYIPLQHFLLDVWKISFREWRRSAASWMLTLLALDSMLRETFSVNCISPTLDSNGIDWANIHGPSKFVFPSGFHLSNELVIELETFRSKEHEKPGFLSEWLSRLQGKAVVASECMKSVRSVMKTYKGLYKARDGAKLSAFLKEEFKSGEKHVPTASCPLVKLHRKNKVNVNHTASSCSFKRQGKRKKWKSWRRTSWSRKLNIWTMF